VLVELSWVTSTINKLLPMVWLAHFPLVLVLTRLVNCALPWAEHMSMLKNVGVKIIKVMSY